MADIKTTVTFTEANWKRMIERNVRARKIHDHGFTVPSTTQDGVAYFISVRVTADNLLDPRCSCPAGRANIGCCHALATVFEFNRDTRHLLAIAPESWRAAPTERRAAA